MKYYKKEKTSLDLYIEDISKIPLLTVDEEKYLIKQIKKGDADAKNKLIESNLKFVIKVAKKFQNKGLPFEDLINEGNIGLIKAVKKYDPKRETKFITYAVYWIKQTMYKALNNLSHPVRLSANNSNLLSKIKMLKEDRMSIEEMSEILGKTPREIDYIQNVFSPYVSLDVLIDKAESNGKNNNYLADPRDSFEKILNLIDEKRLVSAIGKCLTKKEADIIKLRYGFSNNYGHTLKEISNIYKLCRERIRQIQEKAEGKLKRRREIIELKNL